MDPILTNLAGAIPRCLVGPRKFWLRDIVEYLVARPEKIVLRPYASRKMPGPGLANPGPGWAKPGPGARVPGPEARKPGPDPESGPSGGAPAILDS